MDYAKHRLWTTRKEDLARQAAKQQSKETSKDDYCFGPKKKKKKKNRFKFEQEEKRLRKVSGKINSINRLFDIFLHYKGICHK